MIEERNQLVLERNDLAKQRNDAVGEIWKLRSQLSMLPLKPNPNPVPNSTYTVNSTIMYNI